MSHAGWGLFEVTLSLLSISALAVYWFAVYRLLSGGQKWSGWRTISFSSGVALLLVALLPQMVMFAHHDLRGHMVQHLLLGMLAPLGLVFGAPVTLALRASPRWRARKIVAFFHFPFIRVVSSPFSALVLNIGGMYVLYMTPLYGAMLHSATLHALVHWHFLLAGCLFTWAIAGADPAPRRPGKMHRLVILFIAMATHGFLAKAMYAYGWPVGGPHSPEEIREAAKIMYYGGDFAELLLVIALFKGWFPQKLKKENRSIPLASAGQSASGTPQ